MFNQEKAISMTTSEKVSEMIKNRKNSFENPESKPNKSPFSSISMRYVNKGNEFLSKYESDKSLNNHLTRSLNISSNPENKMNGLRIIEADLTEKSVSNSNRQSPRSEATPVLLDTLNTPNSIKRKHASQFKKLTDEKGSLFKRYQNLSLTRPSNNKEFSLEKSKSRSMMDNQVSGFQPVLGSRHNIMLNRNPIDRKSGSSFVDRPFPHSHKSSSKNLTPTISVSINGNPMNGNLTPIQRRDSGHGFGRKFTFDTESTQGNDRRSPTN